MFCKSGILIFIFAENNYSIYAHTMLIKTPLLHQSSGPHVFLSLSLSLRLIFWSAETRRAHSPAQASKTLSRRHTVPSPHLERAPAAFMSDASPVSKDFIGFMRKPRNISLFLSFPFLSSTLDHQVPVH